MTENDNHQPGAIPPYREAITQYQYPAKQSLVNTVQGGSDFEYDAWQATIEYGRQSDFANILDFFVNLPSLQDIFADGSKTEGWRWEAVEPETLKNKFYYRPELLRLLRSKGVTDPLIIEGWLLKYDAGRIDTETTWSDTSYLLATNNHFLYIQLYMEIIH